MIVAVVLLIVMLCYMAFQMGRAWESLGRVQRDTEDLADGLRRAAATREWRAP